MEIKILLDNLALDDLLRLSSEIQKTIEHKRGNKVIRISELDISVRCYRAFSSHDFLFLHEMVEWSKEECSELRNMGKKSIEEMTLQLEKYGLNWKK